MPGHPSRARLVALLALVGAVLLASGSTSGAATSNVTVSMAVGSHISLTNNCTSPAATSLGSVLPGSAATTASDASACRFDFTSNNDSAMLRLGQRDGTGTAMQSGGAWSSGFSNSGKLYDVATVSATLRVAVGRQGAFHRSVDSGATWTTWQNIDGAWAWLHDVEPVPGAPSTCYAGGTGGAFVKITNCDSGTPAFTSLTPALLAAGWPSSGGLLGLETIGASTLIVVGEGGWVAKSTDGGASFGTAFQIAGASNLYAVDSVDANTIIAVGAGSPVNAWRTTTGGGTAASWSNFSTTTTTTLNDVDYVNSTTAYAVGASGTALHWNGTAWAQIPTSSLVAESLSGVAADAAAPATVYAVAGYGQIVRSINAGATWSRVDSGMAEELSGVDSISGTDAIAVGDAMGAARTTDGVSWVASYGDVAARTWAGLAAHPTKGQVALAAGSQGRIRRTSDGGQTWTYVATPSTKALLDVAYGTGSIAYAVGEQGTILTSSDGGATWSARASGFAGRLWGVAAAEGDSAWAVGDGGTILRTTDGGASWQSQTSGTTSLLRAVSTVDRERVVVVGRGVTPRTTNGGATWSAAVSGPSAWENLVAVDHATSNVLYAAGGYRNVWKSTDAGATWKSFLSGRNELYSISAIDADNALIGSSYGRIVRVADGGATVSSISVGGSFDYLGLVATGRDSAMAVGTGNIAAWQLPSSSGTSMLADYGAAPANWAGSGSSSMFGVCLQSVGAGTTPAWTVDTTPTGSAACTASDSDPWNAIPASATKVASLAAAGTAGRIDLVWGARLSSDQAKGAYSATVVVEALAPNV